MSAPSMLAVAPSSRMAGFRVPSSMNTRSSGARARNVSLMPVTAAAMTSAWRCGRGQPGVGHPLAELGAEVLGELGLDSSQQPFLVAEPPVDAAHRNPGRLGDRCHRQRLWAAVLKQVRARGEDPVLGQSAPRLQRRGNCRQIARHGGSLRHLALAS